MHLDGAIDFSLGAEQVAEGDMDFDRILIDLDQLGKNPDGIVRIVSQQVIEPLGITLGKVVGSRLG